MRFSFLPKRSVVLGVFATITLLLAIVTAFSLSRQASAQTYTTPDLYQSYDNTSLHEEKRAQLQRLILINAFLHEGLSTLTCQMIGIERTTTAQKCLVTDPASNNLRPITRQEVRQGDYKPGGIVVFASNAIGQLYTKPASLNNYTNYLAGNFGIVKSATAQVDCQKEPTHNECVGTGFQSLNQIQNIWTLSRNIVYLLLVIVFVIIGFAIMLRVKIDPRTVMSIQNQIPKAIVAIILITFSYAIAGLLIDFMWVSTYFGINAITQSRPPCSQDANVDFDEEMPLGAAATTGILNNPIAFTTDIFGDATGCFGGFDGISGLGATIGSTFADAISRGFFAVLGANEDYGDCGLGIGGDSNILNCVKIAFFTIIKYAIAIFAVAFVIIAIFIALLRLWIRLLKAYIFMLIDIIFAPFWILVSILPGSSLTFNLWIRNLVAQLAVFPAAAILLVVASLVASDEKINNPGADVFLPPLIGNPNIADNLGALIAFGFILLTPDLMDMIRDALKSPASKYSGAVGAGIKRGNPIAALTPVAGIGYTLGNLRHTPVINKLPGLRSRLDSTAKAEGTVPGHGPP